jgi:NitT/TauT family transport system permease protein
MKKDTPLQRLGSYVIALAVGIALWEIAALNTKPTFLASFTATMAQIWQFILDGTLEAALASSLALYVCGMAIAIVVGVLLGLLLARVRLLRVALESYITILYATPMVALIPFILSTMGFGFGPKVLVVFLFAFFPILYNTVEGARSLKPELLEVAQSFRSSEWCVWRDVLLPYTLPFALTGIRQSVARGLVGMIAAELFLSSSGIGQLIMRSGQDFDIPALFGSLLVVTILGVALMAVGRALEGHFAAWRGLHR